jgi:hypothetical protein
MATGSLLVKGESGWRVVDRRRVAWVLVICLHFVSMKNDVHLNSR